MLVNLNCSPKTKGEKIEHLEELIDLLENNSNYELALIDDVNIYWCFNKNFWGIKDNALVLENWFSGTQGKFLFINESTIVKSFRKNFLNLWENLPAENKDKEQTISWLREQIKLLSFQHN